MLDQISGHVAMSGGTNSALTSKLVGEAVQGITDNILDENEMTELVQLGKEVHITMSDEQNLRYSVLIGMGYGGLTRDEVLKYIELYKNAQRLGGIHRLEQELQNEFLRFQSKITNGRSKFGGNIKDIH